MSEISWKPAIMTPRVLNDADAMVTGDAVNGFLVRPSEGVTVVNVDIPQGIDPLQVVIEVSSTVESVSAHGARVKIVRCGYDITPYLYIPNTQPCDGGGVVALQSEGVIDLAEVRVRDEIVKEVLDPGKGAIIKMNADAPVLITAPTHGGLDYQFFEGTTLDEMIHSDDTIGNGQPWMPRIKVKGGDSAFYSVGVGIE